MRKRNNTLKIGLVILLWVIGFISIAQAQRIIHFAGVDWQVKNGGPYGPGPNYWSDNKNSVWLDDQERLHLAIRKISGIWYCAEVSTVQPTSYGEHRFLVDGYIDRMDKNIVLGLFVYANDASEIDIEYSKWDYQSRKDVGSYTVQPYSTPGNHYTFESPLDSSKTTHFFNWQPGYVLFGSMHGHYYRAPPSQNYYIAQWAYRGKDNPSDSRNLHTHINFWLNNGEAPQNLSVLEVIITDVVQPLNTGLREMQNKIPKKIALRQNYPNPFNPTTTIEYSIAKASKAQLSLYNVLGQKLMDLVNQRQNPGAYRVDLNGSNLPSGVYFYKLKAGSFEQTRKMLLVK